MNPNKALWKKGDFTQIALLMRASGESLVATFGAEVPGRVLDLGRGDGTTAVPMAQMGADVTGIDTLSTLVAAGNLREKELGLANLHFQEGDACHLEEMADDTFDLTVSVRSYVCAKTVRSGAKKTELSPKALIDRFLKFYGPTMNAFEAAAQNGKTDDLLAQLVELAKAQNESLGEGVDIAATFMRVLVSV